MATNAGAIGVTLSADSAQFDASMDKAAASAERAMQRVQRSQAAAQVQGDKLVASVQRQVDTFGMSGSQLDAYNAKLLGVSDRVVPLIDRLNRMRDAQASFAAEASKGVGSLPQSLGAVEHAAGRAAHGTAGMTRELLVLGHEASQGNYKRLGGSLVVMAELLSSTGLSLTGLILPLAAIGAGVGVFAAAVAIGAHETTLLNNAMRLTGNAAGITAGQVTAMSREIATGSVVGIGKARSAIEELIKTGEVGPRLLQPMATAVVQLEKLTGESSEVLVKDFAKMGEGVAKWAAEHNRQYNFISGDQYAYIKRLEEQGQKEQAEAEVLRILNEHLKDIPQNLGLLERAWKATGAAASGAWESMKGIGRAETVDDRIAETQKRLDTMAEQARKHKNIAAFSSAPEGQGFDTRATLQQKQTEDQAERYYAQLQKLNQAEADRQHKAQIAAIDSRDHWREETKGVSLVNKELEKYRTLTVAPLKGTANEIGAAEQAAEEAAIRKRFDPKDTKAAERLDTRYKDRLEALTAEGIKLDAETANFHNSGMADHDSRLAVLNLEVAQGKLQGLSPQKIATLQGAAAADDDKAKLLAQTETRAKATQAADKFIAKLSEEADAHARNARETDLAMKMAQLEATGIEKGGLAYDIYAEQVRRAVEAKHDQLLVNKLVQEQLSVDKQVEKLDAETAALGLSSIERTKYIAVAKLQAQAEADLVANPGKEVEIQAALRKKIDDTTGAMQRNYTASRTFETGVSSAFQKYSDEAANAAKFSENVIGGSFARLDDALLKFTKTGKLNLGSLWQFMSDEFIKQFIRMQVAAAAAGSSGSAFGSILSLLGGFLGISGGGGGFTSAANSGTQGDPNFYSAPTAAVGIESVPRDGYLASLHKGEMVVPAAYNPALHGMAGGGPKIQIINNHAGVSEVGGVNQLDDGTIQLIINKAAEKGAAMGHARVVGEMVSGGIASQAVQHSFGLTRSLSKRA